MSEDYEILEDYILGKTYEQICKIHKCGKSRISRIVKEYKEAVNPDGLDKERPPLNSMEEIIIEASTNSTNSTNSTMKWCKIPQHLLVGLIQMVDTQRYDNSRIRRFQKTLVDFANMYREVFCKCD